MSARGINPALLSLDQRSRHAASGSSLLLPVKRSSLDGRFPSVPQLFLPPRVDLVCIFLESQECTLQLFVGLGILNDAIGQADIAIHASFPEHPRLLSLAAGDRTLLGPILVAESTTTSCQDDIGVGEVFEEGGKAESVHATRDDGCSLDHALPLLVVVGAISLVLLQHVSNALIRSIALHLAKTHGADVDATSPDDPGDFGVHKSRVSALSLGTGDGTMASPVIVQKLLGEVPARNRHRGTAG